MMKPCDDTSSFKLEVEILQIVLNLIFSRNLKNCDPSSSSQEPQELDELEKVLEMMRLRTCCRSNAALESD
jgi:hypothetical protein